MNDLEFLQSIGISAENEDFNLGRMALLVRQIEHKTMSRFTFSGIENLNPKEHYLYICNHRDIFLDPALMQLVLISNGFEQSHVLAGQNLMCHPLMINVCKANKVFCIERGDGGKRAFYESMSKVSEQIYEFSQKGESVWIAQRNGRTKDGIDATDVAILKMLAIAGEGDWATKIRNLHIVPLSISYEWEPCDELKALEMWKREQGPYEKAPGEDMHSIVAGMRQWKGRVHLTVGDVIKDEDVENPKQLAALLDERISAGYKIWPNTYIARDMVNGNSENVQYYTQAEKEAFIKHIEGVDECLRDRLLQIYSMIKK